ncbi:MAG: DUF1838 domain-containing protein, partial [Caulobacterales bacterium]|nr:DUF1838 domain-containing protein [Caulobacterales bacterium]
TNETIEMFTFILGPVARQYTPDGIIAPGIAPNPLRISVVGDRVFIPAQSIETFPNLFSPEEWPKHSSGPDVYWDSLYTFSARLADVANPDLSAAPAVIQMQNLTSWQPFFEMGQRPGRTMARAFGQNISGFDALAGNIRADFEKHTPEIMDTDNWTETRFDTFDYFNTLNAKREAGEL